MKLFDAHCHFPEDGVDPMLDRAAAAGVYGMAVCGTSPENWAQVVGRATSRLELFPTKGCRLSLLIGIHPWFVGCRAGVETSPKTAIMDRGYKREEDFQTLGKLLRQHSEVGVGETGLDFCDRFENRREQEACFVAHLNLARELDRPIAVHCVQAWGRLIEILKEHPAPCILLHAYSGSAELIPELMKLNGWFSFGEAVMNPKSKKARASVVAVPAERLLIETDSAGEPEKLVDIARTVAELRGVPVEEIADLTFTNAQKLFAGS